MEETTSGAKWAIYGGIAVFVLIVLIILNPFVIIGAGERGVVLFWGNPVRVMEPGLNMRIPVAEKVRKMDVTTLKKETTASAASKDLQNVSAVIAVNYNLNAARVEYIWTQFKGEHEEVVIAPAVQESVKAATAKYTAEELITKREAVKGDIQGTLKERLQEAGIIVTNVSIVNFDFSSQFNEAIEAKVQAEQKALKAKNDLERIKFEAEQKVATAEAEAKAIRLSSDAANNARYVELKQLEVQLKFAEKWNGILPVNLYGSAPIPFLQLAK